MPHANVNCEINMERLDNIINQSVNKAARFQFCTLVSNFIQSSKFFLNADMYNRMRIGDGDGLTKTFHKERAYTE